MGLILCQWAKALGATIVGTISTSEKAEAVRAAGCDYAVVRSEQSFVDVVREVTDGEGCAVVYEAIGKDTLQDSLDCLHLMGVGAAYATSRDHRRPRRHHSGPGSPRFIVHHAAGDHALCGEANRSRVDRAGSAQGHWRWHPRCEHQQGRAKLYGIQPAEQSFLHLELGTMHLLHAVDRSLGPGASVACLVPGTVLNGNHHERLRRHDFLISEHPVPFDICEVW